jgi:hypothetical protein
MRGSYFTRRDQIVTILFLPLILVAPGLLILGYVVWTIVSWLWDRWVFRHEYRRMAEEESNQRWNHDEHVAECRREVLGGE